MRLILIRHGQTPSNVAGALDTALPGAPPAAFEPDGAAPSPLEPQPAIVREAIVTSAAARVERLRRDIVESFS